MLGEYFIERDNNEVTLNVICPFCKTVSKVKASSEAFQKYTEGMLAQEAFPEMRKTDREKIISGLCEKCQKEMFN